MPRYKLTIEYDGAAFVGWQLQKNGRGVQGALEEAAFRLCGEAVRVHGSGRTDAGVHASGQVAHLDLPKALRDDVVRDALNAHLVTQGDAVAILCAEQVPDAFDARFSAKRRHYLYRIVNRRAPAPLLRDRAWHVKRPLDVEAMNDATGVLIGKHDFTSFRAAECQAKSPVKTLEALAVERLGEEVLIRAAARSFLHNQVRAMVGALVQVGNGRWSKADLQAALDARDRERGGPNAPAHGLYFVQVEY